MKPRLESLPLTDEDRRIRQSIALRKSESVFDWPTWMRRMIAADRRDAELMYQAQSHPLITAHIDSGEHCEVRGFLTSMRRAGALQ